MGRSSKENTLRIPTRESIAIGLLLAILWIVALAPRPAAATYDQCIAVDTPGQETVAYWRLGENVNLPGIGGVSDQVGTSDGAFKHEGQIVFDNPGRTHDGSFSKGFNLGDNCGRNDAPASFFVYDPDEYATGPHQYHFENSATQLGTGTLSFFVKPDTLNHEPEKDSGIGMDGVIVSRYNILEMYAGYTGIAPNHGRNEFGFEIVLDYNDTTTDDPHIEIKIYSITSEFGPIQLNNVVTLRSPDPIPREEWSFVAFSWKANGDLSLFVEGEADGHVVYEVDSENYTHPDSGRPFSLIDNTMPMVFGTSRKVSLLGQFDNLDKDRQLCASLDEIAVMKWVPTETQWDIRLKCIGGTKAFPGWFSTNGAAQANPGPSPPAVTTSPSPITWRAAALMRFHPPDDPNVEGGHIDHHDAWPDPESGTGICNGACRIKGVHVRENGNILLTYHSGERFGTNPDAVSQPFIKNHEVGEFNPGPDATTDLWGHQTIEPGKTVKILDLCVWGGQQLNINAISVHPDRDTLIVSTEAQLGSAGYGHCAGQQAINPDLPASGVTGDYIFNVGDGDAIEYNGHATAVPIPAWEARTSDYFVTISKADDDDDATPGPELLPGGMRLFFAGDSGEFDQEKFRKDENVNAIHVRPNGNIVMSTTSAASGQEIGGKYFERGDILEFNPHPYLVDGLGGYQARKIWNEEAMFKNDENIGAISLDEFDVTLDRFTVINEPTGLHCADNKVTVIATNTAGNVLAGYTGTIILFSGYAGEGSHLATWSTTDGANPVNMGTVYGALFATYTFAPEDQGSVEFTFRQEFGHSGETYAGRKIVPYVQQMGDATLNGTGQEITLYPVALTLTNEAVDETDPELELTTDAMIAGMPNTLHLTAYGSENPSEACAVVESYTGTKSLASFWIPVSPDAANIDPNRVPLTFENGENTVTINGGSFPEIEFTNGRAVLDNLQYDEVGTVNLYLLDIEPGSIAGSDQPFGVLGLWGQQLTFGPHHFEISGGAREPLAGLGEGTVLEDTDWVAYAGEPFNFTVTAKNAKDATTKNFGHELTPQTIDLLYTMTEPDPELAVNKPTLQTDCAGCSDFVFSGGVATAAVSWDAVGTIQINADVNNHLTTGYLDKNLVAVDKTTFGKSYRFSPAYFSVDTAAEATNVTPANTTCTDGSHFTYANQGFDAEVTLQARTANDTLAQNYHSQWITHEWDAASPASLNLGLVDQQSVDESDTLDDDETNVFWHTAQWENGTGKVGINLTSEYDGPAKTVTVQLDAISLDADGAVLQGGVAVPVGDTEIRVGRIHIPNAYGSELEDLEVPIRIEYKTDFNGNVAWVRNEADVSCTQDVLAAAAVAATGSSDPEDMIAHFLEGGLAPYTSEDEDLRNATAWTELPSFVGGETTAVLGAPASDDLQGSLGITFDNAPVHLQPPPEPSKATFGIHKASRKRVFIREVY